MPARFWEVEARCFVGRFSFGRRMVPEAGALFGRRKTGTSFSERGTSDSFTPHVLRSIAFPTQPGRFEEAEKVRRLAVMEAAGLNICQGTPWSEELDGKELQGAGWRQVRSGVKMIRFFPAQQ